MRKATCRMCRACRAYEKNQMTCQTCQTCQTPCAASLFCMTHVRRRVRRVMRVIRMKRLIHEKYNTRAKRANVLKALSRLAFLHSTCFRQRAACATHVARVIFAYTCVLCVLCVLSLELLRFFTRHMPEAMCHMCLPCGTHAARPQGGQSHPLKFVTSCEMTV